MALVQESARSVVTKHGRLVITVNEPAPLTLSHFQPSRINNLDHEEQQCMEAFRRRLVYCILEDVSRPSWKGLMLQAAHEEPALLKAVIAFSVLCDAFDEAKQTMTVWDPKATENMVPNGDEPSINVVLLCTIVCICFELIMNSSEIALCHLDHSLRVLNSNSHWIDQDLALAFIRLDLQASVFLGLQSRLIASNSTETADLSLKQVVQDPESELANLMGSVFTFLRIKADNYRYRVPGSIPLDLLLEAKLLEDKLHQFRKQYLTPGTTSNRDWLSPAGEAHLRIKCLTGIILVATSLYSEEAIYDQFTCDFLAIVDSASEILSQVPKSPISDGGSPRHHVKFTLDMAVIHPLYITASKCRSSLIRRRAIKLLHLAPSLEGSWDAMAYAKIAERLMQLEEACLEEPQPTDPAVVPEWCRIHSADIYPQSNGKSLKIVFRFRPNGMDGEWSDFSETIAW
ncbi:C6 finger domain protein [Metarhizium acridum CQMa 102]|uniref:C6 finger domain protein n=1 Tax=Metarhizium acridum (strain CQMa 102) TaxID=655827 RepID=E9DXU5_METAQ|nr:C6 finger domain protein [Metarhizium acridum CQMa 102]EFY91558.1 C6 finger domain protein [Metarhizium acridum CQMa 102]